MTKRCLDCNCKITGHNRTRCKPCSKKRQLKMAAAHQYRIRHTFKHLPKMTDDFYDSTLAEIADIMELSEQRVEQISLEALYKYRIEYEQQYGTKDIQEIDQIHTICCKINEPVEFTITEMIASLNLNDWSMR